MPQQNIFQSLFSPFRRLSRGSVLILVIVLLLMLTILGTVYLSTSRAGRINSAENLLNAQADMHAEGIADAAAARFSTTSLLLPRHSSGPRPTQRLEQHDVLCRRRSCLRPRQPK